MHSAIAVAAFAAFAAAAPQPNKVARSPQGVSSAIAPSGTAEGCSPSYDGTFGISTSNVSTDDSAKRSLVARQAGGLTITLENGIMKDADGRTGYIASNSQFQFDAPPQAGAIYTSGWSVCPNNTLAIGNDAIFFSCLSGTFSNLYDENELGAGQCTEVYINVIGNGAPAGGSAPAETSAAPSTSAAPETSAPAATSAPAPSSAAPAPSVTQISDGQPQAPTGTGVAPASSYTGPAIATGAAAPTGVPQQMMGLAGAALAAVALF